MGAQVLNFEHKIFSLYRWIFLHFLKNPIPLLLLTFSKIPQLSVFGSCCVKVKIVMVPLRLTTHEVEETTHQIKEKAGVTDVSAHLHLINLVRPDQVD